MDEVTTTAIAEATSGGTSSVLMVAREPERGRGETSIRVSCDKLKPRAADGSLCLTLTGIERCLDVFGTVERRACCVTVAFS